MNTSLYLPAAVPLPVQRTPAIPLLSDDARTLLADQSAATIRQVDLNILIGLSWMGEAKAAHVQRIWLPQRTLNAVQRRLRSLSQQGLIGNRSAYDYDKQRRIPKREAYGYALTEAGFALVEEQDQTVDSYLPPRNKSLMDHDLFTSEVVTRVVELGRPVGLSGLIVFRENRLDPQRRRPIVDAVIIARYDSERPAHPVLVPWTKDPYLETESRRRWSLENDRGTEPLNVLAEKAENYKRANTLEWRQANGFFPVPLLVTPSQARMERIFRLWQKVWPDGAWLMTTDAGLQADRFAYYNQGLIGERRLFGDPVPEPEVQSGSILIEGKL